jgi:hypothetical protein
MTRAFVEMDKPDMGRASFDSSINGGFGRQTADFDLSGHGGPLAQP